MKIKSLLSMAIVAMMAVACTNEANDVLAPEDLSQGSIHFKATMSPKKMDATTRSLLTENENGTLSAKWEVGDKVYLEYETNFRHVTTEATVTEVGSAGYATIEAELDKSTINGSDVDVSYNILSTSSDGTLNPKLDVRHGTSTLKVEDGVASLVGPVELLPKCAIVKFTTKDMTGKATPIYTIHINLNDGKRIILSGSEAKNVFYAALPVMEGEEVWFTAYDASNKPYIAKRTANLKAGFFYQTELDLATAGDVVLADGTFAAPKAEGAIAMIAYIGYDASLADYGLAIALEDASDASTAEKPKWVDAPTTVSTWASSHAVTGGTWRLPSVSDWMHMFQGCGSTSTYITELPTEGSIEFDSTGFQSLLKNAGSADLSKYYWTSSENNETFAWYYNLEGRGFWPDSKNNSGNASRAVLTF